MSKNIEKLIELNDLASIAFRRKHMIVLKPDKKGKENINPNIIYDKAEWKLPDKIQIIANELSKNKELSNEEKILSIFELLCKEYIYDDNVLSYIQKIDDDSYSLPDWYGRNVDYVWEENREQHNRRVCYEVSRYLAEALKNVFKDNENFNICVFWDKGLTHYFVGLTCNEYSITLDLDDFNNIKDLTRVKTGLTIQGINVLEDKKSIFKNALDKFNKDKSKDAIKKIENEIVEENNNYGLAEKKETNKQNKENEDITFLKNAIEILKENYDIDSQGLFEFMKEIVDIKLGPETRKKAWKKMEGGVRYIRCLILDLNGEQYIIDVDKKILREFDEEEFKRENSEFIPYKELSRSWEEKYDGR